MKKAYLSAMVCLLVVGMSTFAMAGSLNDIPSERHDSYTITFKLFDREFTIGDTEYMTISVEGNTAIVEFTHRIPIVNLSKMLIRELLLNPILRL